MMIIENYSHTLQNKIQQKNPNTLGKKSLFREVHRALRVDSM